jgi:hypothetical protein
LVLQVMHCSRPGSDSSSAVQAAPQQGSSAVGADVDPAGCSSVLAGTEAGAAGAGSSSDKWGRAGAAAPPAADHTPNSAAGGGSSSSGGSWMLQRVARLRMPDSVTAVAAFNKELLLVATRQVLALYQLKDDQLSKAAYCFVRAPIVSLSAMPAAASLAAASGSLGMVLAADTLMGVTVFQVRVEVATLWPMSSKRERPRVVAGYSCAVWSSCSVCAMLTSTASTRRTAFLCACPCRTQSNVRCHTSAAFSLAAWVYCFHLLGWLAAEIAAAKEPSATAADCALLPLLLLLSCCPECYRSTCMLLLASMPYSRWAAIQTSGRRPRCCACRMRCNRQHERQL